MEETITAVLDSEMGDGDVTTAPVAEVTSDVDVESEVDVDSAVDVAATGVPTVDVSLSLARLTGPGPEPRLLEPSSSSGIMIIGSASASGPVPLGSTSSYRW